MSARQWIDLPPVWLVGFMATAWAIDRGLPLVQAFGFPGQRVAGQDAGNARVALGEGQQQGEHLLAAPCGGALLVEDHTDTTEQGLLDKLDDSFEHLRLAGEVTVERGLGYAHLAR